MKLQEAPSAVQLLKQVPAFSELTADERSELASRCELRALRAGAQIGSSAGHWAGVGIILSGQARLIDERDAASPLTIDNLSAGAVFGNDSLLSGSPLIYSVCATSDCTVLLLSKGEFDKFLADQPALLRQARASAKRYELRQFLVDFTLLGALDADALDAVLASWRELQLKPGEFLVREGGAATEVFIVREGRLRVCHDGSEPIAYLERGAVVGEMGVMGRLPRNASVIAETDCHVFAIAGEIFRRLASEQQQFAARLEALIAERRGEEVSPGAEEAATQADAVLRWSQPAYQAPPRSRFLKRYAAVRQQSVMDCGAACLATMCRQYSKRVSLNRMRDLARVAGAGASMLNIMQAAQTLGFETFPILATLDHLKGNQLPAIANWRGYHWIVVHKVGDKFVTAADPARGLTKIPLAEFLEGWTRYTLYMRPTPRFAEVQESAPTLEQFTPYLRPYRRTLLEIAGSSLAIQVLALLLPMFIKFVIDDVIVAQHTEWLTAALIGVSLATVLQLGVSVARQNLLMYVTQRVNLLLLSDFYAHILKLPLPFFEKRKVGDVISRLEENTKITTFFTSTGIDFFIDTITAVLYLALMFHYNVRLTLVAAAFLVLHIANIYILTPYLQHGFREAFQRNAELQGHTIESLSNLRTIRTLGIEHYIRWTWENLFARFTNAYFKTLKYTIASGLASQFVNIAGSVAVLFYGATMVLHNQLTVGELVAFTVLVQFLMAPITKLVGTWDHLQETLNSVERLNDVYESKPEESDQQNKELITLPPLSGHLRFEDVTFRYDPEGRNVLQNITLEILSGQRVGFVGRSGSGKSTLVKLLLGFYPVTSGQILVDGFDIANVLLPSLRRQVGVVPQDSFLFHGTVRDNIAQARPEAGLAEVEWAANLANAHEFISRLPHGYETVMDEQGSNLSGGQRQRIAIARAILQRPRMIMLDEATSALDNESERRFLQNLDAAFTGCTVLMIAHRLSTVRNADLLVVLDHGNIVEKGTHEELIERRGLYYFLSTQQLNL